ncbi:hypothetical protein cypCar_00025021 [Cyprinus carpio]|nr:hypothetical protein cypCar_00025021 [Cyprinus carpio]
MLEVGRSFEVVYNLFQSFMHAPFDTPSQIFSVDDMAAATQLHLRYFLLMTWQQLLRGKMIPFTQGLRKNNMEEKGA